MRARRYSKELISRGRYAEVLADNRPFSADEEDLFKRAAMHAYESFRNKARPTQRMRMRMHVHARVCTAPTCTRACMLPWLLSLLDRRLCGHQAGCVPTDLYISH